MGKIMISLTVEAEKILRDYVKIRYVNKRGALSLVFEDLIRDHVAPALILEQGRQRSLKSESLSS